jgi:hypothetical protein
MSAPVGGLAWRSQAVQGPFERRIGRPLPAQLRLERGWSSRETEQEGVELGRRRLQHRAPCQAELNSKIAKALTQADIAKFQADVAPAKAEWTARL